MRPLIAITATMRHERPSDPSRLRLNAAYVDAVSRAGGIPLVAPPIDPAAASAVIAGVRGVLVTGGEDLDPWLFGATPHRALGRVTRSRDAWEIALVKEARTRGVPVLGVCRGIQVLNVALGGTLIQDIPSQCTGALAHEQAGSRSDRTHPIACRAGSRLAELLGPSAMVNSMHHQAVDVPAPGLAVTATAPDGVVEGVEWTDDAWWAVGVQWHPEELDGADGRLFRGLVAAAGGQARA
jgi:putative glutamine amidotransferase